MEQGPGREREEVDLPRGDVLTHLARGDGETSRREVIVQLAVDQMHLTEVRPRCLLRQAPTMFHRRAAVRIAFDAEPGEQPDEVPRLLAEGVVSTRMHCGDVGTHPFHPAAWPRAG